jgi:tetratricopeptide (TPR) repeat protein
MNWTKLTHGCLYLALMVFLSCKEKSKIDYYTAISALDLKRGEVVSCGPKDGEIYGSVSFTASVPDSLKRDFNVAVALLHSFEYDESEKMFSKIIDSDPGCAMAYWGVAMCNFHPLWFPPSALELKKGARAVQLARSIKEKTKRESEFIEAIGKFYEHSDQLNHKARVLNFEKAMEKIYQDYPGDTETTIFYALALDAAADPADKAYSNQRKAFALLNPIFEKQPLHPGIAHYIIHNCDYPGLAEIALPAARKYASIAPASAHAQHMPSHIFTRLGLWDECIQSNLVSVSAAKCYAEGANIKGHWEQELHGLDYLVYAYLQKGQDDLATQQFNYVQTINEAYPASSITAYAFAAIPARYFLERKMWKEAALLPLHPANFAWEKFPWQEAIIHFTRVIGAVNTNQSEEAKTELDTLKMLYDKLARLPDKTLEAPQVAVQVKAAEAWIEYETANNEKALDLMKAAADMEDAMAKHPVTPSEIVPARELLGEMLLQMNKPQLALEAFETDLKARPNRFNALYDAGLASEKAGDKQKAGSYFRKLVEISDSKSCKRMELQKAKSFLLELE